MGTVIQFPIERRYAAESGYRTLWAEPAAVIILPTVRIERHGETPSDRPTPEAGTANGRRRRRRASPP